MEPATLWLAFVAAAAAVASAVFAFVQARAATETLEKADAAQEKAEAAQAKAEEAQAKANEIAESARSELARSAAALERANELTEASRPKPAVRWELSPTHGSMWACKNVGDLAATLVQLSGGSGIYCDEDSRSDVVPPGQALEFGVMRGAGITPVLTIEWDDESSPTRNSESIPMRGF